MKIVNDPDVKAVLVLHEECRASFLKLANTIASTVERRPDFVDHLISCAPTIFSHRFIYRLLMVAGGRLDERLIQANYPASERLRRFPVEQQTKLITSGITLVVKTDHGWDTLQESVESLSREQAAQVFGSDVRSEGEQRAWLEDRFRKIREAAMKQTWRLSRGWIYITKPCVLRASDLFSEIKRTKSHQSPHTPTTP